MKLIDCHTHCFPAPIAAAALAKLRQNCGGLACLTDGTAAGLLRQMDRCSISAAWVLNIATAPQQQQKVNDFAASLNSERLIAFGSIHPQAPDAFDELERIACLGLRGLKLHPYFQDFSIDEPRMRPIYRKAARLGLVTVFHVGYDIGFADTSQAAPQALAKALGWFDGAPVVAAHLGGSFCWQEAERWLAGQEVYFDTAFTCGRIPLPQALRLVARHGPERVLFGTDLPWSDPEQEASLIHCLGLATPEKELIFSENARRLLPA